MKQVALALLAFISGSMDHISAQGPEWQWARSGVGEEYDQANAVTTDANGNVIVAGSFSSDEITFDGITVTNSTPGFSDLYIVKYGPTGNVMWASGAGGGFDDGAYALATDAAGNVYLTGSFYSPSITFGSFELTNAGNVGDICIVKYDPAGTVLWAMREGAAGLEIPHAIAVDDEGNIIVGGRFSSNSVTFGTTTLALAGSMDVFIVKYNAAWDVLWAQGAGGGSNDEAYALAVDQSGDIIVAGYYTQEADFGSFTLPNPGLANIFLAKCDAADGTFQWAKETAADGDERVLSIALDALDNIYVGGYFASESLVFGTTTLISTASENGFIAGYDSDGDALWAQAINVRSRVQGVAIANGAFYACGKFHEAPLIFGTSSLSEDGGSDLFVLKCDLLGNAQWAANQSAGGESGEIANAITADVYGNLVMAGGFDSDEVTYGAAQLTNSNGYDAFVIRMGDPDVGIGEVWADHSAILFPNPTTGVLMVSANMPLFNSPAEVLDLAGRQVLNTTVTNDRVDVSGLAPGQYIVRIRAMDKVLEARFSKQ